MTEISWKSASMNKGQKAFTYLNGVYARIEHIDRKIDPYLAVVIKNKTVIYTGLHATLADARQTCERKAK
jgi:hypothetical protein